MMQALVGMLHVRKAPLVLTLVGFGVLAALLVPVATFEVVVDGMKPGRGIGAPEVYPVLVASFVPALSIPRFSRRELLEHRAAHIGQTIYTTGLLFLPLLTLAAWRWRTRAEFALEPEISALGLVGTPFIVACLAMCACLAAGPIASVIVGLGSYVVLVLGQHLLPGSFLTTTFAMPKQWRTPWEICAALLIFTVAFAWYTRSLPLRAGTR